MCKLFKEAQFTSEGLYCIEIYFVTRYHFLAIHSKFKQRAERYNLGRVMSNGSGSFDDANNCIPPPPPQNQAGMFVEFVNQCLMNKINAVTQLLV